MEKIRIGEVSEKEKDQIYELYLHRSGLMELAQILPVDNPALYNKVIRDLGNTNLRFQEWWDKVAIKYQWPAVEDGKWRIDFKTCEVFLLK